MRWMARLRHRFRSIAFNDRVEAELDEEMRDHVERLVAACIAAGMSPAQARDAARREMGGVEQRKEECRDARGLVFFGNVSQDVRYALRMLRRNPGFALLGILVMALGIGANTAVFSVVNAVLLDPLPYHDADRIVTLSYVEEATPPTPSAAAFTGQVSAPDATDWHDQSTTFEAMAYYSTGRASVMAGTAAEYARVSRVRPEYFRVFGVTPSVGRPFSAQEESGGAGAALVTSSYARLHFGNPERALGQTLRIYDRPIPVVGVLPAGFTTPDRADVWLPMPDRKTAHRRGNNFRVVARVKPSATIGQAQAEISAIAARLARAYPETNANHQVIVTPLHRSIVGDARLMLLLLLGAVGLVLLVAGANMATLLLARATARTSEMGVRMAIGAGRARIVRQVLVEGLVQALLAGSVALAVAVWATRALVALAPGDVPRLADAGLDMRVLAFTLGISVLVSLLFALPPAIQAARTDVNGAIGQGANRAVLGGRGSRTREALVVLEIALSVVLLAGGLLLVQSLLALQRAPLGFEPRHVLAMETTLPAAGAEGRRANDFFTGLLADVSALPGVTAVGATMAPPGHVESSSSYFIDHLPETLNVRNARMAVMSIVAPGTFATLGIPVKAGRDFHESDTRGAARVAAINEALAREAFRGQDPIGRVIYCAFDSLEPMRIVGVVGDVRQYGPALEPSPECYMPALQHSYNDTTLTVIARTAGDAGGVGDAMQRMARARAPDASVKMTTLEAILSERMAAPRFRAVLIGLFAAIALCLSMAGVYGVTAYSVGQRSTEIGLRMALGATTGAVLWLLVRRGLVLAVCGVALGLTGAAAAARLLSGMLFGVTASDATTYAAVAALLGAVALVAIYIPARRSAHVDPLSAMRQP